MRLGRVLMSRAVTSKLRAFRLKGLCGAPVTPFKNNGDINPDRIPAYIQHFVDFGVPNAYVNGTTGEGNTMTLEERKEMAEVWMKHAKGKLSSVVIHIGANNLRDSQNLAEHAERIGADAIACVGTTYYKPETMDSYVNYMAEVASAAPSTPFMLYDIDFITGITHDVPTFFTLAKDKIPSLCSVKHTTPNAMSIHNMVVQHPDIQCILGTNELYLQGLSIGVEGNIMNSYNGPILNSIRDSFNKGDIDGAREWARRALLVGNVRKKLGFSVPRGAKAVLNILGLDVGQPRLPLAPTTPEQLANLKRDLKDVGYFDLVPVKV